MNNKAKNFYIACTVGVFALLLAFPETASDALRTSAVFAVSNVLPSLFPFMVLSSIASEIGLAQSFTKPFSFLRPLFGIPRSSVLSITVGNLCGFPVGSSSVLSLYEKGEVTSDQALRVLVMSNNVSVSFAVCYVGKLLFLSSGAGVVLWAVQLSASFLCALLLRLIFTGKNQRRAQKVNGETGDASKSFSEIFTSSVSKAALSSLYVVSFICVFSVVGVFADRLFALFNAENLSVVFKMFLEMSSASALSASVGGRIGFSLCAFALGFSGLSVICQSAVYFLRCGISVPRFACIKLLQGILSFAGAFLLFPLLDISSPAADLSGYEASNFHLFGVSLVLLTLYMLIKVKEMARGT